MGHGAWVGRPSGQPTLCGTREKRSKCAVVAPRMRRAMAACGGGGRHRISEALKSYTSTTRNSAAPPAACWRPAVDEAQKKKPVSSICMGGGAVR